MSTRPNLVTPGVGHSPQKFENEKKRGPGRPPGSTRQNIEQQRVAAAQAAQVAGGGPPKHPLAPSLPPSGGDIVKVSKDSGPVHKKAKTDFENGPPSMPVAQPASSQHSEVKAKYNIDILTNNPLKWSVTQVCDFVKNLPGCSVYVEDFQLQEIDGQALMLLKSPEVLMNAMALKLGPALKICNAIEAIRDELKQN